MQYRKHNLYKNFTAAANADVDMAWEILINEINELAIDRPVILIQAIKNAKIKVSDKDQPKTLSLLVIDNIYTNKTLQEQLAKAMAQRHKDPYVNADGGSVGSDVDLLNPLQTIISDQDAPEKAKAKKLALSDLASKLKQRGLKINASPVKVIVILGLIAAGIYVGYKLYNNKPVVKI